jgi:hypothetical protein
MVGAIISSALDLFAKFDMDAHLGSHAAMLIYQVARFFEIMVFAMYGPDVISTPPVSSDWRHGAPGGPDSRVRTLHHDPTRMLVMKAEIAPVYLVCAGLAIIPVIVYAKNLLRAADPDISVQNSIGELIGHETLIQKRMEARGSVYVFLLMVNECFKNIQGIGSLGASAWVFAWILPVVIDGLLVYVLTAQCFDFHGKWLCGEIVCLIALQINVSLTAAFFRDYHSASLFGISISTVWYALFIMLFIATVRFAEMRNALKPGDVVFGFITTDDIPGFPASKKAS